MKTNMLCKILTIKQLIEYPQRTKQLSVALQKHEDFSIRTSSSDFKNDTIDNWFAQVGLKTFDKTR